MEPRRAGGRLSFGEGDSAESMEKAFFVGGTAKNIRRTVRIFAGELSVLVFQPADEFSSVGFLEP